MRIYEQTRTIIYPPFIKSSRFFVCSLRFRYLQAELIDLHILGNFHIGLKMILFFNSSIKSSFAILCRSLPPWNTGLPDARGSTTNIKESSKGFCL